MPTASKTVDIDTLVDTVNTIELEMKETLIERDRVAHLMILSAVACTHGLLLGEGGIAKTMAAKMLHSHITDSNRCYVLCNKALPLEVLVGNLSLKALTERDELDYNITGHLPTAHWAILDEIFKLNGLVANGLLSILNERVFTTGAKEIPVPLLSLIGTSNMAEYKIGADIAAFSDRFSWRVVVEPVSTEDSFERILRGQDERARDDVPLPTPKTTIALEGLQALQAACRQVTHPDEVYAGLRDLWTRAKEESLHPSERRYGELMKNMKAQALLRGDMVTNLRDCALAQDMLFTDPEDHAKAVALSLDFAGAAVSKAAELRESLAEVQDLVMELQGRSNADGTLANSTDYAHVATINKQIRTIRAEVDEAIGKLKSDEDGTELKALVVALDELHEDNRVFMAM